MNYDSTSSPSPSAVSGDQPVHGADATRTSSPSLGASPPPAADGPAAEDSCAWCGRGPSSGERDFDVDETWPSAAAEDDEDGRRRPTTTGGGGGRRYDQLRFCSRSCVGRYKMDLFCRETQRYLHQLQASAFTARSTIIVSLSQSCPWVGLTHGLGWVGLGRDFSVFGGLGWVHFSKSSKELKGLF